MYKYISLFVYGIITPSILSFGIYYTFHTITGNRLEDTLINVLNKIIEKNIDNIKDKLVDVLDETIQKHIKDKLKLN